MLADKKRKSFQIRTDSKIEEKLALAQQHTNDKKD
jgi:hypothetical protein